MFQAFLKDSVLKEIEVEAKRHADKKLEAMGLLLGNCYSWQGEKYVVIDMVLMSEMQATAVSVKFSENGLKDLLKKYSESGGSKLIVGWWHSHPSYDCFLSSIDVSTQEAMFSEDFNVALVVDPFRNENDRMKKRFFKVKDKRFYEVSFAVMK